MHPDLSPHLHTPECNRLIEALLKCHQENKFKKFMGACNDANTVMLKCLKKEHENRRVENFKKSVERQKKIKENSSNSTTEI